MSISLPVPSWKRSEFKEESTEPAYMNYKKNIVIFEN